MSIIASRRGFIAGLGALIAAPPIVRASSLMQIRAIPHRFILRTSLPAYSWRMFNQGAPYGRSPLMDCLPELEACNAQYRRQFAITLDDWARIIYPQQAGATT